MFVAQVTMGSSCHPLQGEFFYSFSVPKIALILLNLDLKIPVEWQIFTHKAQTKKSLELQEAFSMAAAGLKHWSSRQDLL